MTSTPNQQVIVAGAGPVGLTLALLIVRSGIPVTVLERRDTVNLQSKASTFHASTLDLLETCGVLEEMLRSGTTVECVQYRTPGGEVLAQLEFALLDQLVRHPVRMHYEQGELSKVLAGRLLDEGGKIEFGSELSSLTQDDRGVTAIATDGDVFKGSVIFGCDGAQSAVREAVRIGYVEKPYPGMALRLYAKTDLRKQIPGLGGIVYLHEGDDTCSLLEMPDCWRIIVRVPAGISEAEATSDDWVVSRLRHLLPISDILPHVSARDVYSARRRRSLSASCGRVYLAGDALHLTNTKGGMNLNAAIHDAFAYADAAIRSMHSGDMISLDRAAWERERVTRELLLPRTDQNIGTGSERVRRIADLASSREAATRFLAQQAMLDMLAGVPEGLVGVRGMNG